VYELADWDPLYNNGRGQHRGTMTFIHQQVIDKLNKKVKYKTKEKNILN